MRRLHKVWLTGGLGGSIFLARVNAYLRPSVRGRLHSCSGLPDEFFYNRPPQLRRLAPRISWSVVPCWHKPSLPPAAARPPVSISTLGERSRLSTATCSELSWSARAARFTKES